jgi:hypothetical protein
MVFSGPEFNRGGAEENSKIEYNDHVKPRLVKGGIGD